VTCPFCKKSLDGHTQVAKTDEATEELKLDLDKGPKPEEGAISFCIYCSRPAIFTMDENNELSLRTPTKEEVGEMFSEPIIAKIHSLIVDLNSKKKGKDAESSKVAEFKRRLSS